MPQEELFFAHANGFPGGCYGQMFHHLTPDFKIDYIDSIGHTPEYPVTENWEHLVWELIYHIERKHSAPVIGVGHSLGGVLTFMAGIQKPKLFKAIILLDTPILGRWKSCLVQLLKRFNLIDHVTPGHRTLNRREEWPSKEEAFRYLKERSVFQGFTDRCLQDYIEFGMEQHATGVALKFRREIEYQIYRTLPHNLPEYGQQLQIPAGILYGQQSEVVTSRDCLYLAKRMNLPCCAVKGGHLFPFEHPKESADALKKMIKQLVMCYSSQICTPRT